jgi:D-arabinose 1-dehydrogenase-like Zn-dependent alcohol dehydrogenase
MKAAQISKAGGDWELVERDIREPGPGQVRVKVEACGICHSCAVQTSCGLPLMCGKACLSGEPRS